MTKIRESRVSGKRTAGTTRTDDEERFHFYRLTFTKGYNNNRRMQCKFSRENNIHIKRLRRRNLQSI